MPFDPPADAETRRALRPGRSVIPTETLPRPDLALLSHPRAIGAVQVSGEVLVQPRQAACFPTFRPVISFESRQRGGATGR